MSKIKAVVFDVYGTLLDPISVESIARELIPDALPFVMTWRAKQLEYSWLTSLMEHYHSFWELTENALEFTCDKYRISLDAYGLKRLLDAWGHVSPYPEVPDGLKTLREKGLKLAALSNGNPEMLEKGLGNAGIQPLLDKVMSVEEVEVFKPSPKVYQLALDWLKINDPAEVGFVSSNSWDAIGATAFGFTVCWLNRAGNPLDSLGYSPAAQVADFSKVVEFFS
jgi:2-haloacid dehalogenase